MRTTGSICVQNRMYSNPARRAVRMHARTALNYTESNQHADEHQQERKVTIARSMSTMGAGMQATGPDMRSTKNNANPAVTQQKTLATRTAARPPSRNYAI